MAIRANDTLSMVSSKTTEELAVKTTASRQEALAQAIQRADDLLDHPTSDRSILEQAMESLRSIMDRISSDDEVLLKDEGDLRSLWIRGRKTVQKLHRRLEPEPRALRGAKSRRSTAEELSLRRCPGCDGHVLFALHDARLRFGDESECAMIAVVCDFCGLTRLYVADRDRIRRASSTRVERIELPMGEGPFRQSSS
jgi:RNase P subunit RPR2